MMVMVCGREARIQVFIDSLVGEEGMGGYPCDMSSADSANGKVDAC